MDSIIFDVDGTLWDSTDVVAKAWTDYLRQKEQIDLTITAGQLKTLFGKPLAEIAALVFPEYPENEQLRLIDGCCEAEHALLHITGAPLYEDLEKALQEQGFSLVEFSRLSNCKEVGTLLTSLQLVNYASGLSAFTYQDANLRIVFLQENLSQHEQMILLSHELGHILCGI